MYLSSFQKNIQEQFDKLANKRKSWKDKNSYYYETQTAYYSFLIPKGKKVLEIGCGTGELLAAMEPCRGVGIDLSGKMIQKAEKNYPELEFYIGSAENIADSNISETFDYIIIADLVGHLEDIQRTFQNLHRYCNSSTRVIVSYYNYIWEPVLKVAERFKLKMPVSISNWLSSFDIQNLLYLGGFESVKTNCNLLFPKKIPFLHHVIEMVGSLPLFNHLCLSTYVIARPMIENKIKQDKSVSVVVPCKNEKGNIEPLVKRLPDLGTHTELIFIDGHSQDGTPDEIKRVIEAYPEKDIKFLIQDGNGKGDAVRKAFADASNDILMILDADITVAPEDLPKFYNALVEDKGEFINGSRLVYPMEEEAMRFLNILGNKFFSQAFTWLLNQRIKDTLCGTKVLSKAHYDQIAENRDYFGDFDPFGDFDLLFGASKLNLKIVEVPVRYNARKYGQTQISRFQHGFLLLKMSLFAIKKLKWI